MAVNLDAYACADKCTKNYLLAVQIVQPSVVKCIFLCFLMHPHGQQIITATEGCAEGCTICAKISKLTDTNKETETTWLMRSSQEVSLIMDSACLLQADRKSRDFLIM